MLQKLMMLHLLFLPNAYGEIQSREQQQINLTSTSLVESSRQKRETKTLQKTNMLVITDVQIVPLFEFLGLSTPISTPIPAPIKDLNTLPPTSAGPNQTMQLDKH